MGNKPWHGSHWPLSAPYDIDITPAPVHALLEDAARTYPDHPFIIFNDRAQSFQRIDAIANGVAHFLIAHGIAKGDRVALFLPNLPHFPAVFFGILKAGAVCVTCNPTYSEPELHHQLSDTGARCLFCFDHPTLYATACAALRDTAIETVVYCSAGDFLPLPTRIIGGLLGKIPHAQTHQPGHLPFNIILPGATAAAPTIAIDPLVDLALIQYTGGTTGIPKGACMTHHNIVTNLYAIHSWVHPEDADGRPGDMRIGGECFIGALPWFHAYGLVMTLLAGVKIASKVICVPDPRAGTPPFTEILRLIDKHRATVLNAVPTLFSALIHHPNVSQYDLRSLRLCGCGAAPLALELARQFEAATGAVLYEGYGMTEAAAAITCNPTNRRDRKLGSLGLPVPGTDALIVDMDDGTTILAPGEIGEIAVSGPQIMSGYWQRPEETAQVFRTLNGQRYLLTGDIGHMDEDGFFWLNDRKKDIVIIGGYKAYPREIEEVLYTHPQIAQAAVIGIAHERLGQSLKAFVKVKPGAALTSREVITYCKERLAGYKVPRVIEFRDSLPTSPVGKVLKRELS